MKSQTSQKFGQIRPPTAELAVLVHHGKSPLTYNGKMMSPLFILIILILAGNEDMREGLN